MAELKNAILVFTALALFFSFGVQVHALPFISTWNTSANSSGSSNVTSIALPLYSGGSYNFSVNWGDGSALGRVVAYNSVNATHNYNSSGIYTVSINGSVSGFRFNNAGDRLKISNVIQWGDLNVGNNNGYFSGCSNLVSNATDALNLTGTTDFSSMFQNAFLFNGNLSGWNVSKVITMVSTFQGATSFNQNLSTWSTSNVTSMLSMFSGATAFNGDISSWNTGKVLSMSGMFQGASSFNSPIGSWNTSLVTSMANMFNGATAFNQSLSLWNTANVNTMANMFNLDTAFNSDISSWNTGKVTTFASMFQGATSFNSPMNSWNTTSATTIGNMFNGAIAFNQPIGSWNTINVVTMGGMFNGATAFNQPIGSWIVSNVTSMLSLFLNAVSFNQNLGNWDTGKVTSIDNLFRNASSFNGNVSNWNLSSLSSTSESVFSGATAFNQPIGGWDVSRMVSFNSWFANAVSFNQPLNSWNTMGATGMGGMFSGATTFNQNLSNWNVSKVTNMIGMLSGTNLSTQNYDSLLNGWLAYAPLKNNTIFDAGTVKYSSNAQASRNVYISNYHWSIFDGGLWGSPVWTGNASNVVLSYSPSIHSKFNITWSGSTAMSSVLFESNYSGVPTNYTMQNLAGNVYNYSVILSAGSFYWRSFANDSNNQWGMSDTWQFYVSPIQQSNLSVSYPTDVFESGNYFIFANYTNGTSFIHNASVVICYTFDTPACENMTELSNGYYFNFTFAGNVGGLVPFNVTASKFPFQNQSSQFFVSFFDANLKVRFWTDLNMTVPYFNSFMWVYAKPKCDFWSQSAYLGFYTTCNSTYMHAPYVNGTAEIHIWTPDTYELYLVDGTVSWANSSSLPSVASYEHWMKFDEIVISSSGNTTKDYFWNTTIDGQYPIFSNVDWNFWLSVGGIIILIVVAFVVALLSENGIASAFVIVLVYILLKLFHILTGAIFWIF